MSLHVDIIPNRKSRPTILLREARREGKKIRKKTLCNLTHVPSIIVDGIRAMLKGGVVYKDVKEAFSIKRTLPHGHVAAVLGVARNLGLDRILHRESSRARDLALGAVVLRVLKPNSKLATSRGLSPESASTSLGAVMGLGSVTGNEMLSMLDWLVERQRWIERTLASRHLKGGTLVLYDVTSSYFEGRSCPLAFFGHNRDKKKGKKQIVYGLLCSADGCPVAVEVFCGNTGDPATVGAQVMKIQRRFGVDNVALVGDRGMITTARIREDIESCGLEWISALKTTDIRKLLKKPEDGEAPLSPEALVPDGVGEIASPEFPGERLIVCLNPRLREQRARKREELLVSTERILEDIKKAVRRKGSSLRGKDNINRRVGREANRRKVEKHFEITVTDDDISWSRDREKIEAEARLDGIYIIRTSLDGSALGAAAVVSAYKSLSRVERAFRLIKTTSLRIRPFYVYSEPHVRGHVLLCMLAYYVQWHLRRLLAPLLFEDCDREGAEKKRRTPVEKAMVSDNAKAKSDTKKTPEGLCVHSFETLMEDLATFCLNEVALPGDSEHGFVVMPEPTPLQKKAFELLGIDLGKFVPSKLTG